MHENEIKRNNIRIANFIGYRFVPVTRDSITNNTAGWSNENLDKNNKYFNIGRKIDDLNFNCNWELLMLAIDIIEKTKKHPDEITKQAILSIEIRRDICSIYYTKYGVRQKDSFIIVDDEGKISATYKCILLFISWYNKKEYEKFEN